MKTSFIIYALLISAGIISFGCNKHNTPSLLSNTYNMAGMRVWSGVYYGYTSGFNSLPDIIINTSGNWSILVINDSTIRFADTMKYTRSDYRDTIMFTRVSYYSPSAFVNDTIWYNYLSNVITRHFYEANSYNEYPYSHTNEHSP